MAAQPASGGSAGAEKEVRRVISATARHFRRA